MKRIHRVLLGIPVLLIMFALLMACTPGKAQAKQTPARDKAVSQARADAGEEEISFDDDEEPAPRVKTRGVSKASDDELDEERSDDDTPKENSLKRERYFQVGKASWYGREFHGKKTASGDKFNMYDMTAAHKTLPFGTILEVTNMRTGKKVEVRVNDRGPYRGQRILDLSYNAAKNLGMIREGEAQVGIKILQKGEARSTRGDDNEAPRVKSVRGAAANDGGEWVEDDDSISEDRTGAYSLQAGAFYSKNNANTLKARIENVTDKKVRVVKDGDFYKVRVDGIRSKKEASGLKRELREKDIESYLIEK